MRVLTLGLVFLAVASSGGALSLADLQNQVDRTPRGQTIVVPPGLYQGELVLRRPVVLRAMPGARLVHSPGTKGPTLWIQSPDVVVEGLEVEGSGEGTRQDRTAVLVSASRVTLSGLGIRRAWSGVWLDRCDGVTIRDLRVTGPEGLPFWERGEGIRITGGTNIGLEKLQLSSVGDGVYVEHSTDLRIDGCQVREARYGLHSMFSSRGTVGHLQTSQTVAGLMLMESSRWTIRDSQLVDGYRTGSAGVREIRTMEVDVLDTVIARQASGVELLDVRSGSFRGNQVAENGIAWTWGGDNSGTVVGRNVHLGNLLDFAGQEPSEKALFTFDAHNHGVKLNLAPAVDGESALDPTELHVRPRFEQNYWDAWAGTDLDQDGFGDTPYRFDPESAVRAATRPWAGVFLGSPWSQWSRGIPGGEVIDEHPRTRSLSVVPAAP